MLKVFGHIYSSNNEDFEAMTSALEDNGFEIAYEGDNSGTVIKDVVSLDGEEEDAES